LRESSLAVELNPDNVDSWLNRGVLLDALSRRDEALADFDMALRLAPRNPRAYYNRAWLRFKAGRAADAADDCTTALSLDPTNNQARKLFDEARRQLQQQDARSTSSGG
jgi:tetratricopeptide (TPR) repeat protein